MKLAVAHLRSSRTNCEDDSSTLTVAVKQIVKLTVAHLL